MVSARNAFLASCSLTIDNSITKKHDDHGSASTAGVIECGGIGVAHPQSPVEIFLQQCHFIRSAIGVAERDIAEERVKLDDFTLPIEPLGQVEFATVLNNIFDRASQFRDVCSLMRAEIPIVHCVGLLGMVNPMVERSGKLRKVLLRQFSDICHCMERTLLATGLCVLLQVYMKKAPTIEDRLSFCKQTAAGSSSRSSLASTQKYARSHPCKQTIPSIIALS